MRRSEFNEERALELFKQSGRTREWIAKECGITTNYLGLLFNGKRSPSKPLVKLLAQTLEVDEDTLTKRNVKPKAS